MRRSPRPGPGHDVGGGRPRDLDRRHRAGAIRLKPSLRRRLRDGEAPLGTGSLTIRAFRNICRASEAQTSDRRVAADASFAGDAETLAEEANSG